jgi:hypothetical protein
MATETKTAETTSTPAASAMPKKSARITLTAGDATLLLNAKAKSDGTAETFVTTTTGTDAKPVRGMTTKHKTFAEAQAAIDTLSKKAETAGWKRKAAGPVFKPKPDAFSALPAPPKTAGKKS